MDLFMVQPQTPPKIKLPSKKKAVSRLKNFILDIICLTIENHLKQKIKSDPVYPLPSVEED